MFFILFILRKLSTAVDKLKHSETDKTKRRHSVGEIHGRKPLSSANDSLNMSAGSGLDDSINSRGKESRSERHKRVFNIATKDTCIYMSLYSPDLILIKVICY